MSRFGRKVAKPPKPPVPEVEADLVSHRGATGPLGLADLEQELTRTGAAYGMEAHVAAFTAQNWGGRHENEDRIMTVKDVHGSLDFYTIGVLDGHDTEAASDSVSRLLPAALSKHLKDGKTMEQAYTMAMAEVEDALKKLVATAGTCICSCTVAGRFVWCANLGDCRAALIPLQVPETSTTPTKATGLCWMSRDHKASSPEEMRRIREAGGTVVDGRVEGLEPSRTLGDFDVKMQVKPGVISIVPEVRCRELGTGGAPSQAVLICATDGVWDVISGQDICDLIHARKELSGLQLAALRGSAGKADTRPLQVLAEDLVQFAIARGSRDDCTAVAALLSVVPNREV